MANPFKAFRKHQKGLMAVIGVLTMVSFIILPSLLQKLEVIGRGNATSAIVSTEKYGDLSSEQINQMRQNRYLLQSFFSRLQAEYLTLARTGSISDAIIENYSRLNGYLASLNDLSDQTLVLSWLMENKAKEMGFVVESEQVNDFLRKVSEGLDSQRVVSLIQGEEKKKATGSTTNAFFAAMKSFLMAENYAQLYQTSIIQTTTVDKWEAFSRVNQKATVELYPVKVEDYISKTQAPTDAEIAAFFESNKEKFADMNSKEPGLKQPQKIVLEYCYGSPDAFMDLASVTEEQMKAEYEQNPDRYAEEDSASSTGLFGAPAGSSTLDGQTPVVPAPDFTLEPAVPAVETPAPAVETPAPAAETPAPAVETPAPAVETPAPAAETPVPAVETPAPAVETPAPAAETPAVETSSQSDTSLVHRVGYPPMTGSNLEQFGINTPKKTRPYEEVKELIRQSLAREAAQAKLNEAILKVQGLMNEYETAYSQYKIQHSENDVKAGKDAPAALDLQKIASDYKLKYAKTGYVTEESFRNSPLANLYIPNSTDTSTSALSEFFGNNITMKAFHFQDQEFNSYAIWKTEDVAPHVPTLDEPGVKEQVIDQIKYIAARKIAQDEAKSLLEKATKDDRPLQSCLGDAAFTPPQFPFMTLYPVQSRTGQGYDFQMYPSHIEKTENAGFKFIKSVFEMKKGEISVLPNDTESIFYIVRIMDLEPSYEQLGQSFQQAHALSLDRFVQALIPDKQMCNNQVIENLISESGLKWNKAPQEME